MRQLCPLIRPAECKYLGPTPSDFNATRPLQRDHRPTARVPDLARLEGRARLSGGRDAGRADPRRDRQGHPSTPVLHPARISARGKLDAIRVQAAVRPQPKCSSGRPLLPLPKRPAPAKTTRTRTAISNPEAAAAKVGRLRPARERRDEIVRDLKAVGQLGVNTWDRPLRRF
jgi:hypothetical protein